MNKLLREVYIRQTAETNALFTEFCEFIRLIDEKEKKGEKLYLNEMRDLCSLWDQYAQAQIMLDHVSDVIFGVEDEAQ